MVGEDIVPMSQAMSILRLLHLFDTDLVDADRLAVHLQIIVHPKRGTRLRVTSIAATIYRCRSNATIDNRALQQYLSMMHWMWQTRDSPLHDPLTPATLDLPSTFSYLYFFKQGRFDIEVSALHKVIAISAGDNVWVASPLVNDPYSTLSELEGRQSSMRDPVSGAVCTTVVAFTGNVGRPGISFLVPPMDPIIRPRSIHDFRRIVHEPFGGNLENDSHGMSLHLSFTSAKSNISGYFEGLKDCELEVLETALGVYERGEWVADLDVLKSMASGSLPQVLPCAKCQEQKNRKVAPNGLQGENKPGVTAITSWTELLDPPETAHSILKASRNWEARLAASVIAVASGYHAKVLPDTWCWMCGAPYLKPDCKWILIS